MLDHDFRTIHQVPNETQHNTIYVLIVFDFAFFQDQESFSGFKR